MNSIDLVPVFEDARAQSPIKQGLFHQWVLKNGVVGAEFYHVDEGYLLRFPELADFVVSKDGQKVKAFPVEQVSQHSVSHLFLNQVLPLALSRQFRMVLHAAAVDFESEAIAFVGPSGMGKSTLVTSFSMNGYGFLTDDGLEIETQSTQFLVHPSHPSVRLWDDSRLALIPETHEGQSTLGYNPKYRLLADEKLVFCDQPRILSQVYFLANNSVNQVQIKPVKGREAMLGLVRNCFLLDIEEREMLTRQFDKLTRLAREAIFFELDYPRRYSALPDVRKAIIDHARSRANAK